MTVLTMETPIATFPEPSRTVGWDWIAAATRAHAILSQSLSDDVLDMVSAGFGADRSALQLPPVLVG